MKSEKYTSFDTLKGFCAFWFTKCQNEKCHRKTQNRGSDGTFLATFRDKNRVQNVIKPKLHRNQVAFTV